MLDTLYSLIIRDPAYRVRMAAITLIMPHILKPHIQSKLIPAILQ